MQTNCTIDSYSVKQDVLSVTNRIHILTKCLSSDCYFKPCIVIVDCYIMCSGAIVLCRYVGHNGPMCNVYSLL